MSFRFVSAALLAISSLAGPVGASVVFSFEETGGNVVGTLSGSLDLTGLTPSFGGGLSGNDFVNPSRDLIVATSEVLSAIDLFPFSVWGGAFGSGGLTFGTYTGDNFMTSNLGVFLRPDYVSGADLSGVLTFGASTFSSLGITPGTYVSSLANGETVTLSFGPTVAAVPLPGGALLLGGALALAGAGLHRARRRRG